MMKHVCTLSSIVLLANTRGDKLARTVVGKLKQHMKTLFNIFYDYFYIDHIYIEFYPPTYFNSFLEIVKQN